MKTSNYKITITALEEDWYRNPYKRDDPNYMGEAVEKDRIVYEQRFPAIDLPDLVIHINEMAKTIADRMEAEARGVLGG